MNRYYQSCEEDSNSYENFHDAREHANHQKWANSSYCFECHRSHSYTSSTASESDINYCDCENCRNQYFNQYASGLNNHLSNRFADKIREFNFNEPKYYEQGVHCLHGSYNFPLDEHYDKYPSFSGPQRYDGLSNTFNDYTSGQYTYQNNSVIKRSSQPENLGGTNIHSLDCNESITKSISHARLSNKPVLEVLSQDSFSSCVPCDSDKIEMIHQNNKNNFSKSTINHSSLQTIETMTSQPTLRKKILKKRPQKLSVNSGYFEFVSPTQTRTKDITTATSLNELSAPKPHSSVHYGYFEVQEKDGAVTNEKDLKKVSYLELDKVPTKISKQVDTVQLKKPIMLDKSLLVNITDDTIKPNKSLTANINVQNQNIVSQTDILKSLRKVCQVQYCELNESNQNTQSSSNKSVTNFKPIALNKPSRQETLRIDLETVRSLSEGSVNIQGKASVDLNTLVNRKRNNIKDKTRENCQSYLDKVLDKLETEICNKLKTALLTGTEVPKRNPPVTVYTSTIETENQTPFSHNSKSDEEDISSNHSTTLQTVNDIINSESVQVDTNDNRSFISSPPNEHYYKTSNTSALPNNSGNVSSNNIYTEMSQNNEKDSTRSPADDRSILNQTNKLHVSMEGRASTQNLIPQPTKQSQSNCSDDSVKSQNIHRQKGLILHDSYEERKRSSSSGKSIDRDSRSGECRNNCSGSLFPMSSLVKSGSEKFRSTRDRSIRFDNPNLDTIQEEYEPDQSHSSLTLLHKNQTRSLMSKAGQEACRVKGSRESINSGKINKALTGYNIDDCKKEMERKAFLQRDLQSIGDDSIISSNSPCTSRDFSNIIFGLGINGVKEISHDDYSTNQMCRNCPRKQYQSQVFPPNCYCNERRTRFCNEQRYCDKLYHSSLDISPYGDGSSYSKLPHHDLHKQVKLLNMITFIVFIVMFYGIFQYIDLGIRNGQFPWI